MAVQTVKLNDIIMALPKSKIKAGDGINTGKYKFFTCSPIQSKYYDSFTYEGESLIMGTGGNANIHYCNEKFATSTDCLVFQKKGNLDINLKCVYYLLYGNIDLLQRGFKGCGLQHISKDYILNIEINLPERNVQDKIVDIFDHYNKVKQLKLDELTAYDNLVKSQFIEMFGELGTDKYNWGLITLGECCEVNPKKSNETRLTELLEVSFVPMPCVSEKGDIDTSNKKLYSEVQSGFTYFSEGDVLFAKITPCMENGKGAVARGLINGVGFGSTEFHVLRPNKNKCIAEWIYAVTSFETFRQDAAGKMTGSAGQRRVPASFLANYKVALPPLDKQNEFARFVEQTDKSKFRIKQSLEKLETCYKALLQRYFG